MNPSWSGMDWSWIAGVGDIGLPSSDWLLLAEMGIDLALLSVGMGMFCFVPELSRGIV